MRTPTAFERERAEGEGAFFGRRLLKRKSVDPLNASEQDNRGRRKLKEVRYLTSFNIYFAQVIAPYLLSLL